MVRQSIEDLELRPAFGIPNNRSAEGIWLCWKGVRWINYVREKHFGGCPVLTGDGVMQVTVRWFMAMTGRSQSGSKRNRQTKMDL